MRSASATWLAWMCRSSSRLGMIAPEAAKSAYTRCASRHPARRFQTREREPDAQLMGMPTAELHGAPVFSRIEWIA